MNLCKKAVSLCLSFLVFASAPSSSAAETFTIPFSLKFLGGIQAAPLAPAAVLYAASSIESPLYAAANAFDGKAGTRWSSAFSDPQWLAVNYGSVKKLSGVTLRWEAAYARAFKIQVSMDGSAWSDVYSTAGGTGGVQTISFAPVSAQHIRMYGTQRATPWGYSLFEMAPATVPVLPTVTFGAAPSSILAGQAATLTWNATNADSVSIAPGVGSVPASGALAVSPSSTTLYTLTAKNADGTATAAAQVDVTVPSSPFTASSVENALYPAKNAFDGNAATRWSSAFSDPQWLAADLGDVKRIGGVVIRWEAAYARAFKIQTSLDGASWTDAFSTANGVGGVQTLTFPALDARHVRMYGTQRATPWGYSLFEMAATVVPEPPTVAFSVSPSTIQAGQSAVLTWSANGAATVTIDQGVGTAAASGTRSVSPAATTVYTLVCSNAGGSVTAKVQVNVVAAPAPVPAGPSLTMVPGREFAADSFVHKPLADDAELDPKSDVWAANIQRQIKSYYGVAAVNINQYTPALIIAGPDVPTVRVKVVDWSNPSYTFAPLQAKWAAVPIPPGFAPAAGTDQEALIYQPSTGRIWEFWLMRKTGAKVVNSAGQTVDEWGARWGGRMDNVSQNPGYFLTEGGDWYTLTGVKYGTTATSLAFLGGLLTIQEQQKGVIDHVVGVALPEVLAYPKWSWPANRTDGQVNAYDAIPEGTIFRLPANLDLDALPMDPYARMIAKAVQKHGMVVWDKAGTVSFRAENPGNQYPSGNPYTKLGGILNCPGGVSQQVCWADSNGRLKGFPWSKLQALKTRMNQ